MKYVKMLGLAAVAAMALMSFFGASSASATVLCTTPEIVQCKIGWKHFFGTTVQGTLTPGTTAVLESGETILDTCTESTVKGTTETTGGASETVKGDIESLTWGNCSRTTTTLKVGSLEIHHNSGTTNGSLTATNGTEVTINTIFGSCVYGSGSALNLGNVTGGNPATIAISTSVPKISGNFACPSTGLWTANYTVTAPKPLYISSEGA